MGKASRTKVDSSRREKIAAQRAAARRAEQRRRILIAGGSILVVVAVVLAFVLVKVNGKTSSGTAASNGPTGSALASVVNKVTTVPASTLDTVGSGGGAVNAKPIKISGPPLTASGKPEMMYIGAEYCPYCAGERWALIVALSRFGTFAGVSPITSSEGSIPTFTFHGSAYTSSYLVFRPVEAADRNGNALDKATAAESALEQKYATGIPFVDFGNRFYFDGATYDVGPLQGQSWEDVLGALQQTNTPPAQGILGSANLITAGVCVLTGQQPAAVCSDSVIQGLERQLPGG
jgi:hypothetical protein